MIIYIAENIINGKCYVGRTIRPLSYRKADHLRYSKDVNIKYPFYNALRKYGAANFHWSVLEECSTEATLIEREDYYIKKFGDYNIGVATDGGDNITNNPRKIDWNSAKRSVSLKKYCATEEGKKQRVELGKRTLTPEKGKVMLEGLRKKLQDPIFREAYLKKQRESGAYSPEILNKRANSKAKSWLIVDPNGISYTINLNKFCKDKGLNVAGMHMVSTDTRKHYKGWICRQQENMVLEGDKQ